MNEHRLGEITVKPAIEQTLVLVTKGAPGSVLQSLVKAVRDVANTQIGQSQ